MSNPTAQHSVNIAIAVAPTISVWAQLPQHIPEVVGVLAGIYYVIWIIKEVADWRRSWRKVTTTTITEVVTPPKE